MLVALVPIIQMIITAMIGGAGFSAALGGVGELAWLGLGDAVLTSLPGEIDTIKKIHPVFAQIADHVLAGGKAELAHVAVQSWLSANADAAMRLQPGIGYDT